MLSKFLFCLIVLNISNLVLLIFYLLISKNHPFYIRSLFLLRIKTLPATIRNTFLTAFVSVIIIELLFKRFSAPNHTFFSIGDIYLKISYSLCAATIFYFINQHLPKEKRKVKALPLQSAAIVTIHNEVIELVSTLGIELPFQNFTTLTRQMVVEACEKINPLSIVNAKESAIPFPDWWKYFEYKSERILKNTQDLLPLYDLFDSEFMGIIFIIHNLVKDNLKASKKKFGYTTLSALGGEIWQLAVDSEHVFKKEGKTINIMK